MGDAAGAEVYAALGAAGVPTTVLYEPSGAEVYRAERRIPRPAVLRAALARMGVYPAG